MNVAAGPDVVLHPPMLSVAAPLAAVALEWLAPIGVLPPPGQPVMLTVGIGVLALAGWLAVAGERAFKRAGTNVDPREPSLTLVRDGPFRFTRNPMYLGMVLLQLGLALTFSLDWALVAAAVVWVVLHFGVVLREEEYLSGRFGESYQRYLHSTRRWL